MRKAPKRGKHLVDGEAASGLPSYLLVAAKIEKDIREGIYPPGSRLPAQRELAQELGLNLSTISRAFSELRRRKLVIGSKRRGTMVIGGGDPMSGLPRPPGGRNGQLIDLTINSPASGEFLAELSRTLPKIPRDGRFRELQDY